MSINRSGRYSYGPFKIKRKDIFWALKIFSKSVAGAYLLCTLIYTMMLLFSEPEPVNSAIATTATTATAKVEVAARYINPFLSIFFFNTIAVLTASTGAGIILSIHKIMVREMGFRSRHRRYAFLSIKMEKALKPLLNLLKHVFPVDSRPTVNGDTHTLQKEPSIWDFCGYTKHEYRLFSRMLPHIVPTLMLVANGMIAGMLLSFFLFNGALEGYRLMGTEGIGLGLLYNITYFMASLLPHAVIELPVLFLAAALGHRFALVQSQLITDKDLFLAEDDQGIEKDISKINYLTKDYIVSRYLWTMLGTLTIFLMLAAYIEVNVTPGVLEDVMVAVENMVNTLS